MIDTKVEVTLKLNLSQFRELALINMFLLYLPIGFIIMLMNIMIT